MMITVDLSADGRGAILFPHGTFDITEVSSAAARATAVTALLEYTTAIGTSVQAHARDNDGRANLTIHPNGAIEVKRLSIIEEMGGPLAIKHFSIADASPFSTNTPQPGLNLNTQVPPPEHDEISIGDTELIDRSAGCPALRLAFPDGRVEAIQDSAVIGRKPTDPAGIYKQLIALPDPERTLSRNHVSAERHNTDFVIADLGSSNGTQLQRGTQNPEPVPAHTPTVINDGDVIIIGGLQITATIASGDS